MDAKAICNFTDQHTLASQAPYGEHLRVCQYRSPLLFAACRVFAKAKGERMANVFAMRNPFEILYPIIFLVAILVIGFMARWAWAEKCVKNEAMYLFRGPLSITPYLNLAIALWGREIPKNLSYSSSGPLPVIPDPTAIRYRVPSFVANDRTPFFEYTGFGHDGLLFSSSCSGHAGDRPRRCPYITGSFSGGQS